MEIKLANNTAGNLIGFFLGGGMRAFLPDAKPKAKPKFQHLADKDAKINRWTGQPHEHEREIARRQGAAFVRDINRVLGKTS